MKIDFTKGYSKTEGLTLTLPDGVTIECAMPSVNDIKKVSGYNTNSVDDTLAVVAFVLNKNKSGKKFTEKQIAEWGLDVIYAICDTWIDWINQMRKN